jgi:hypothetical protein
MLLQDGMSQQRWQQQKKAPYPPKPNQQQSQKQPQPHKKQQQSNPQPPSNQAQSTVVDLPETFGLPSNSSSSTLYSKSATSLKYNASSDSLTKASSSTADLLIDESLSTQPNNTHTLCSPKTQNGPPEHSSNDIEIINEASSSSSSSQLASSITFQYNNDETFKNYLAKTYNSSLSIASKPQSNFISNLACMNQILSQHDFYDSKLRRCKPYSSVKPKDILTVDNEDENESETSDNESDVDMNDEATKESRKRSSNKLKSKKIIVIDDTNEEMHKPWITPELIKLIKHRNLLQSKINENKPAADEKSEADPAESRNPADAELIKKFKNLRNKVTKLVKKARKDYLAKYIQESKASKAEASPAKPAVVVEQNVENSSENKAQTQTTSSASSGTTQSQPKTNNPAVNTITTQLTSSGSFLTNSNNVLVSIYNGYYNQYIQQYNQQQQAQQLSAGEASASGEGMELLQKQAAFYAQQQHGIQTQLEQSLQQAAQQLIGEIASMASAKTNQPFVLNQFSHQQHHLHHHMHQANMPPQIATQMQSMMRMPGPAASLNGPPVIGPGPLFYN